MEVSIHIKKKEVKINSLSELVNNPNKYFDKVDNNYTFIAKEFYLNGVLIIKNNNRYILGFNEWDLIDQLISYFIQSLNSILIENDKESRFFFPDQPLEICLKKIDFNTLELIKNENDKYKLNLDMFLSQFVPTSSFFIEKLKKIDGSYDFSNELKILENIKSKYNLT
jgi:hypothetical protein